MKTITTLFLAIICLLLVSISYAGWTHAGHVNVKPDVTSADTSVLPIYLAIDSSGDLFYATFNSTGVVTSLNIWKISDPVTSPSFTIVHSQPGFVNNNGFGAISIDQENNKLYISLATTNTAVSCFIRKIDLNDSNFALDSSWGGGDGQIRGDEAVLGNNRVTAAIVTNTGELLYAVLTAVSQPFGVLDATGTVNNGSPSTPLDWSGGHPRDFAFNPIDNAIYANQNGRITKWTGGTPSSPGTYVCVDSTQLPFTVVNANAVGIDFSTDSANPGIYYAVITATAANLGHFYDCVPGSDLNAISLVDRIGDPANPGDGTDENISRAADITFGYSDGTYYAFAIDYDKVAPIEWRRIIYYTGSTNVPVNLSAFEFE